MLPSYEGRVELASRPFARVVPKGHWIVFTSHRYNRPVISFGESIGRRDIYTNAVSYSSSYYDSTACTLHTGTRHQVAVPVPGTLYPLLAWFPIDTGLSTRASHFYLITGTVTGCPKG
jgi:hypothetical protein